MSQPHLLVIGPGYSAQACIRDFEKNGYRISIAARRREVLKDWEDAGYSALDLSKNAPWPDEVKHNITHLLTTVAPPREGDDGLPDPILRNHEEQIAQCKKLFWIGYLSSTIVYGDHQGKTVDETTPATPSQPRGHRRRGGEMAWQAFGDKHEITVHLFRLAGIYGPGRNAIETLRSRRARRIVKKGQVFSRIHVDDIAQIVVAAAKSGLPSGVFNAADTLSAPPQDVLVHAAELLGVEPPPAIDFEQADLSPMARSFYAESKRVIANRLDDLGVTLKYPTYHEGLKAIMANEP